MRTGLFALGLASTALFLAAFPVASGATDGLAGNPLDPPATAGDVGSLPDGSLPEPPTSAPPSRVPQPGEGLDLAKELQPDVGSTVWFAVGLGAGLLGLLLSGLLGTRFVTSENVLENDARRTIFEYIKANPGCHLRETSAALNLSTTNVLWHLRKLEESNLVHGKKLEGYKVFYPVEGGVEAKRMGLALAVLRNGNAVHVLATIARSPGVHQREIARILGVNHGTVRWHLKKLNLVTLVLEVRKGAVSQYFISALGLQALDRAELRVVQVVRPPALVQPVQAVPALPAAPVAAAEALAATAEALPPEPLQTDA